MAQAVTQLARFLGDMYGQLPPPVIISPTLEFLQAVGLASSNPLINFVLARSSAWWAFHTWFIAVAGLL